MLTRREQIAALAARQRAQRAEERAEERQREAERAALPQPLTAVLAFAPAEVPRVAQVDELAPAPEHPLDRPYAALTRRWIAAAAGRTPWAVTKAIQRGRLDPRNPRSVGAWIAAAARRAPPGRGRRGAPRVAAARAAEVAEQRQRAAEAEAARRVRQRAVLAVAPPTNAAVLPEVARGWAPF